MNVLPPFTMRFSTGINSTKHYVGELTEIISLVEKYIILKNVQNLKVKNNQIYFEYTPNYYSRGPIIMVEKCVFDISFDNNRVVVRYTFSMQKSILILLASFLILDLILYYLDQAIPVGFIYGELIFFVIFWLVIIIKERLKLGVIRRKVIEYLGTQTRLSH
jgi:hypothetical protein